MEPEFETPPRFKAELRATLLSHPAAPGADIVRVAVPTEKGAFDLHDEPACPQAPSLRSRGGCDAGSLPRPCWGCESTAATRLLILSTMPEPYGCAYPDNSGKLSTRGDIFVLTETVDYEEFFAAMVPLSFDRRSTTARRLRPRIHAVCARTMVSASYVAAPANAICAASRNLRPREVKLRHCRIARDRHQASYDRSQHFALGRRIRSEHRVERRLVNDEESKRRRCSDCRGPLYGLEQRDFAKEVAAAERPEIRAVSRDHRLAVDDYEELPSAGALLTKDGTGRHLEVVAKPCDIGELPT
jgi:hypothetical protein